MPHRHVVLVADDHAEMRRLLSLVLTRRGYSVKDASDGAALRSLLDAEPQVDAVVTDVRMPGMTGLDALRGVRERYPHTVLIVVTAFGDPETHQAAADLGARCLDKPFDPDILVDLIDEALDGAAQ